MKKNLLLPLFLLTTAALHAQKHSRRSDTLLTQQLDSVTVQYAGNGAHRKRGDGFSRTERILENIPGISLTSRGNYAQEAILRGMSDGQINISINGMRIFGACTDRMDPATSYIEPNNLQAIDVATAPAFGNGGASIGGSVQFQLKEAQLTQASQWHGSVSTGWESNAHARQLVGNLQYSSARWAMLADGIFRTAGNYTPGGNKENNISRYGSWSQEQVFTVGSDGKINFSQYRKWNLHLNSIYRLSEQNTLKINYLHDDGSNIGYPALLMDVKYARADMGNLSFLHSNTGKKLSYWETAIYYNRVNHTMDDTKRPEEQISMHMDMPGWSDTKGALTQLYWNHASNRKLKVRLEGFDNRWHAEMTMYPKNGGTSMWMLTIPDAAKKTVGIDLEEQWQVPDGWQITAGGHVEYDRFGLFTQQGKQQLSSIYVGASGHHFFPYNLYLRITKQLSAAWNMHLNIARAMRTPTIKELYSIYLYNPLDNFDYIGNPALKIESAWNLEYQVNYVQKALNAHLKAYGYFFRDYIAGGQSSTVGKMNDFASGTKQYQNRTNARIVGLEAELRWHLTAAIEWQSANSYGYGEDANSNALPYIQAFRMTNTINWHLPSLWHIYLTNLTAGRQSHVSVFYGEKETPGFSILHAGLSKSFNFRKQSLSFGADIRNILNKYYYEHLDVVQLPRQGRNILLKITCNF